MLNPFWNDSAMNERGSANVLLRSGCTNLS